MTEQGGLTRPGIGHAQQEGAVMLESEVLVLKLSAVYALAASTIASSKITTLDHERFYHPVEDRTLVAQLFALLAFALLART